MKAALNAVRPAWRLQTIIAVSLVASALDAASVFFVYLLGTRLSGGAPLDSGISGQAEAAMQRMSDAAGVHVLLVISLAFLFTLALRGAVRYLNEQMIARTQFHVLHDSCTRLFKGYFGLSYETFLNRNSADRLNSIGTEAPRAGICVASALRVVIHALNLVVLVVLLLLLDWRAFAFGGLIGIVLFAVIRPLANKNRRIGKDVGTATRDVWLSIVESFRAYRMIVASDAVATYEKDVMRKFERHLDLLKRNTATQRLLAPVLEFTAGAIIVLAVLASLYVAQRPEDSFPLVMLVMSSTYRLLPAVTGLNQAYTAYRFNEPALEHVQAELADIARFHDPPGTSGYEVPRRAGLLLELEDVHFRYDGGRQVLRGANLAIAPSQRIGIVGPSGSGKSTLVDIGLGLLRPTSGHVRLGRRPDGTPMRVAYLPQQSILLDGTVLENICLGGTGTMQDRAKAQRMLDRVGLGAGSAYPVDLDADLGESGARISGGQRQRLGIARSLYRDPDLLILDEPTAALDPEGERQLVDALGAIDGLAFLIVTHRHSPLRICSEVHRFADGTLVPYHGGDDLE